MELKSALLAFLGDTPAAHEIRGFKVGVGFASRKCRVCLAADEAIQTKVCVFFINWYFTNAADISCSSLRVILY